MPRGNARKSPYGNHKLTAVRHGCLCGIRLARDSRIDPQKYRYSKRMACSLAELQSGRKGKSFAKTALRIKPAIEQRRQPFCTARTARSTPPCWTRSHHVEHLLHPPHAQVHDEPSPCPSPVRECSIPARCGPMAGVFPVAGVGGGVLGDRALTAPTRSIPTLTVPRASLSLPRRSSMCCTPAAPTCPRYDHATQLIF